MINPIKVYIFFLSFSVIHANENNHTAIDVMKKVLQAPKPTSSISEINLEIVRKKMGKTKTKTGDVSLKSKVSKDSKKSFEIFLGLSLAIMNPTKSTPASQAYCNIFRSRIPQIFNFIILSQ